ncbi:MAG: chemotaxis protein CheA [Anaerofustis sp.]
MDNNMDSMLDMYLFETNTLLTQLEDILLEREKQEGFDSDSINEIFRIMHTIKGSSAMMEFDSLMNVAHKIEDMFSYVRETGSVAEECEAPLFDLMYRSLDFLKSEIAHIENNEPLTEDIGFLAEEIKKILEKISSCDSSDVENEVCEEESGETSVSDSSDFEEIPMEESAISVSVRVFFDDNTGMEHLRAFMLVKNIGDVCDDFSYEPSDLEGKKAAEEISKNGLVVTFKTQKEYEMGLRSIETFLYTKDYSVVSEVTADASEKQNSKVKKKKQDETVSSSVPAAGAVASKQSLINVNLKKLDTLMDLVGEIVITESMVTAITQTEGTEKDGYEKTTRELRKLTNELQEIVMSVRMVPVAEIFQKMNRIVRDMSKQLDKEVELTLVGEQTELDKTIVDAIADPLMHLVRNAMDHGVESPKDRLSAGKSEKGHITLTARNAGGEILISVQDDGKGLDAKKIMEKAKNKDLLMKPESEYTEKEIYAFVFQPGFSTKEAVTEFSGRGVGMDVVKNNLEKIGGITTIDSELGKGTTITFKIPLTLAIISGMQLKVGDSEFTLPINNIQQAFKANATNITHDMSMNEIVMLRNEYYSVVHLHRVFGVETDITNLADGILILVEAGAKRYCIFADALLGEQQIVVKQLPIYLNRFSVKDAGITGCAILGTGKISLILDVSKLHLLGA